MFTLLITKAQSRTDGQYFRGIPPSFSPERPAVHLVCALFSPLLSEGSKERTQGNVTEQKYKEEAFKAVFPLGISLNVKNMH